MNETRYEKLPTKEEKKEKNNERGKRGEMRRSKGNGK